MLKSENPSVNMSGSIGIADGNILATISSNFNSNGDLSFYLNIPNYQDVVDNKAMFYTDLESFIDQLLAVLVDLHD